MAEAVPPPQGPSVSVQLTSIVPVRVFDPHGDFFDTEVDVDAPLRAMQLAVEDYFKLKPETQLLLHSRQQIHPERSLRENGCLLLKGDPYIKLVCTVKRGPVLNLRCEVGSVTYVVAMHETATVWELKLMLCDEITRYQDRATALDSGTTPQRPAAAPERMRLLWRYMELHDRATLQYYRIPTNAVLHAMHRKRVMAGPTMTTIAPASHARESGFNRTMKDPTMLWQRPYPPMRPDSAAAMQLHPEEYNAAFTRAPPVAAPQTASIYPVSMQPLTNTAPPSLAVAKPAYDGAHSADAAALAQRVRSLEDQLRSLYTALQEERRVGENRSSSLNDANQRILELQTHMERVLRLQEETARFIET